MKVKFTSIVEVDTSDYVDDDGVQLTGDDLLNHIKEDFSDYAIDANNFTAEIIPD